MNSNEQAESRRPAHGRALRAVVQVSAGAALLLIAGAVVLPVEREVQGAMAEQTQPVAKVQAATSSPQPASAVANVQAGTPVTKARSRQPRIGQIAIPLHKRRRFEAATATRQDMPYRWRVDSGRIYTPKATSTTPSSGSGASRPAAHVAVQPAPNEEPLEAPQSVYGHGGW